MTTPTQWLAPFTVNTGTANILLDSSAEPRAVGLSNGNILYAWNEPGTSGVGTAAGTDIIGKILDAEGNVVIDSFLLNNSSDDGDEGDFDIAATSDGGFVLVYREPEGANQSELHWERFDAIGTNTHSRNFAIEFGATTDLANPQISVDSRDNSSVVSFERDLGGDIDIKAIKLSATGTTVTTEFSAGVNTALDEDKHDSAFLPNGGLITAYETGTDIQISGRNIFTGVDPFITFDLAATQPNFDVEVTALTNSRFVVVWTGNDGAATRDDVEYQVFNSDGTAVISALTLSALNSDLNEPSVVALQDGGFVIFWDDDTANTVVGQRFDNAGSAVGSRVTVDTAGTTPNVAVTSDGRIIFTW